jgi:ABC-type Zn uptake system ZnuABC Zn-binding protein ZnuA
VFGPSNSQNRLLYEIDNDDLNWNQIKDYLLRNDVFSEGINSSHSNVGEVNILNDDFDDVEEEEEKYYDHNSNEMEEDHEEEDHEETLRSSSSDNNLIREREIGNFHDKVKTISTSSFTQLSEFQIKEIIKKIKKEMKLSILLKEIEEKEAMKIISKRFQIPKSILYLISLKKEEEKDETKKKKKKRYKLSS